MGPLTQNDAQATSLVTAFGSSPDLTAYTSLRPTQAGNQRNSASAPMAAVSAAQPLTREDQIDPLAFNQAIWQSVKGPRSVMPWPVHGRD